MQERREVTVVGVIAPKPLPSKVRRAQSIDVIIICRGSPLRGIRRHSFAPHRLPIEFGLTMITVSCVARKSRLKQQVLLPRHRGR
jgi:hypothetical protein